MCVSQGAARIPVRKCYTFRNMEKMPDLPEGGVEKKENHEFAVEEIVALLMM